MRSAGAFADPLAVAWSTVTVCWLWTERLAVKRASVLPSFTLASPIRSESGTDCHFFGIPKRPRTGSTRETAPYRPR